MKAAKDFITPSPTQTIEEFDAFQDFVAVYIQNDGKKEILIRDLHDNSEKYINIDDGVGMITPGKPPPNLTHL